MLFKISKKHYYFRFLAEQFFFKLLLILNGLSQKYQIGLKLKLINNSFKKYKKGNFSPMVYHIRHEKNWSPNKNFDQKLIHSSQINLKHQKTFQLKLTLKLLQNTFHLRPIWYLQLNFIRNESNLKRSSSQVSFCKETIWI